MTSSSSTKLRKRSLFQFQRQKYSFLWNRRNFQPIYCNCNLHCIVINYHWIAVNQTFTIGCKFALGELDWSLNLFCHQKENLVKGKEKPKEESGVEILAPVVHWFQETTSCSRHVSRHFFSSWTIRTNLASSLSITLQSLISLRTFLSQIS